MLPSYFDYVFVHLRQKVRVRSELSPKFCQIYARTHPKSPVKLTTWIYTVAEREGRKSIKTIQSYCWFDLPWNRTKDTPVLSQCYAKYIAPKIGTI